jgi:hypothetical protein
LLLYPHDLVAITVLATHTEDAGADIIVDGCEQREGLGADHGGLLRSYREVRLRARRLRSITSSAITPTRWRRRVHCWSTCSLVVCGSQTRVATRPRKQHDRAHGEGK